MSILSLYEQKWDPFPIDIKEWYNYPMEKRVLDLEVAVERGRYKL